MTNSFGKKLRKFRRHSYDCMEDAKQSLTQAVFADQLKKLVGLIYSHATVSNWERGVNKVNHEDRTLLVGIIKVLFKCGGLTSVEEANQLLTSGNYSSLTNKEIEGINSEWLHGNGREASPAILPSIAIQIAGLPIIRDLIGMETTIVDIVHRLAEGIPTVHIALAGRKGIGKSTVANAVARRFVETSTFTQLVWLSVENVEDVIGSLAVRLGEKLGLSGMGVLSAELQFHQLNIALQQTRCLIIIDGVQTEAELTSTSQFITQLPPPTRVLLTTRIAPPSLSSIQFDVVALPELDRLAVHKLLQQLNPALDTTHCDAIYEQLGGHPDALILLARYSKKRPIKRILSAFAQMLSRDIETFFDNIYAAIWEVVSAETKHLLRLLCFVNINGVSEEMLRVAGNLTERQLWEAVEEADAYGLLRSHGSPDSFWYSIHHLTRQFVFAKSTSLHDEALAVVRYWQRRFDVLNSADWHLLDRDRHNIFQAVQLSLRLANNHPDLQQALYLFARTLYNFVGQRGFVPDWLPLHAQLADAAWLTDRQRTVRTNQLGSLHRQQQQIDLAITFHQQAAQLAQLISDELLQGHILYNLAIAYRNRYEYAQAERAAQQAQTIYAAQNVTDEIAALNLLGTIAQRQGRFDQAEAYTRQGLDALTSQTRSSTRVRFLISLGQILRDQGQFAAARRQLNVAATLLPSASTTLHNTLWIAQSTVYLAEKRPLKALGILEPINLDHLETTGQHQRVGIVLHNRGEAYFLQGYFGKAENALRQAVNVWRLLGNVADRLAVSLDMLGDIVRKRGQSRAAKHYYEEALVLARGVSADYHLNQLATNLENKLNSLGKME